MPSLVLFWFWYVRLSSLTKLPTFAGGGFNPRLGTIGQAGKPDVLQTRHHPTSTGAISVYSTSTIVGSSISSLSVGCVGSRMPSGQM